MLIRELDDGGLLLFQAPPRRWLEDGKRIEVDRAPTFYGKFSMTMESRAASGQLRAKVESVRPERPENPAGSLPSSPRRKPLRSVTVNGRSWNQFDPRKEWVRIDAPAELHYDIEATTENSNMMSFGRRGSCRAVGPPGSAGASPSRPVILSVSAEILSSGSGR